MFVLQGNIGAGKTTLLNRLRGRHPDVHVVLEPVDKWTSMRDSTGKSIFQKFYEDPSMYAFAFQMYVTLTRLNAEKTQGGESDQRLFLYERSVSTDKRVFMRTLVESGVCSEIESNIYDRWFNEVQPARRSVTGTVYLRVDPEECHRRVSKRNRDGEEGVSKEYLDQLHAAHDEWLMPDGRARPDVIVVRDNSAEDVDRVYAFLNTKHEKRNANLSII